jgi:DNA sulfur modification protein DndD
LLDERSREIGRMLTSVRAELATTRGDLTRLQSELTASAPTLRRADLADRSAAAVETLIERLIPLNLDALSRAVTLAYRAMAHKQVVQDVNIAPDGSVSLLDRNGADIRAFDVSAGENQVFAFALMAAIGMISSSFPFIMDTPLARLDPEHRQNVLGFFAGLDRQIILLAQPAELSPGDRTSLDNHLGSVIRLDHETGRSSARMIAEEGERRLAS